MTEVMYIETVLVLLFFGLGILYLIAYGIKWCWDTTWLWLDKGELL